ncbi:MAG: carbohydrate ABC transporter permease [Ktedonobacteraceae bacterium]|nr:carbohydrate ABC transporter permease [Ktedonobacteraceae bacterium]
MLEAHDGQTGVAAIGATPYRAVRQAQKSIRPARKGYWLYLIAVPILTVMILPYAYLLLQSLAPWDQVNRVFVPESLTLRSYEWIWTGGGFAAQPWLNAFFNSLFVTLTDSISMVVLGAIVGYALSILKFRGQGVIYNFILFQMFYPAIILLVPTFLVIRFTGLYNTYWAMILPKLMSLWAIFMYSSFFRSVPIELIEAARLDGAGELSIIFRIMLPIARSITTIIFLFVFMERWTELMWDLIVVKEPTRQTLNVLLTTMFGPYGTYPGPLYAAGVILTFPVLLLFLIFSRNFVQGVQVVLR